MPDVSSLPQPPPSSSNPINPSSFILNSLAITLMPVISHPAPTCASTTSNPTLVISSLPNATTAIDDLVEDTSLIAP